MRHQAASHQSQSLDVAFELLDDGPAKQQRQQQQQQHEREKGAQHLETHDEHPFPNAQTAAKVLARAPASMSAGEVLEELLGRLYIGPDRLTFLDLIGEGGFASVQKCELQVVLNYSTTVAVKKLKPEAIKGTADLKEFLLEANIMRKMHHPHIVELLGVGAENLQDLDSARSSMFLVQEYMGGGDLKNLLVRHMGQPFDPLYSKQDALRWSMHLAAAMYYLHTVCRPMIIHRDLKLENVLLTDGPVHKAQAKLADFGLHKRGHKGNVLSSQAPTSLPPSHDTDRSYYGGASYYSAVLEHDKALIVAQQGNDWSHDSQHAARAAPATRTVMSNTSARLLHLIVSDGATPMDDVSVHRKRQAIQALEQSDISIHTDEDSSLHYSPPDPYNTYRPRFPALPIAPASGGTSTASAPVSIPAPSSNMIRSSSQGNLTQKRVSFMDSIPERRNSDSRMPRLSLDVAEGILTPEEADELRAGGNVAVQGRTAVNGGTYTAEQGVSGEGINVNGGRVSQLERVSTSREGGVKTAGGLSKGAAGGLPKNNSYIGLISLLGGATDADKGSTVASDSAAESARAGAYEPTTTSDVHSTPNVSLTYDNMSESVSSTNGPTQEQSNQRPNDIRTQCDRMGNASTLEGKVALSAGAKMVQASSGRLAVQGAGSVPGLSGSRSRSRKGGNGSFKRGNGSLRGSVKRGNGSLRGSSLGSLMEATQQVGSLLYMAPEMTLGQPYNEKVDVFSFGVLMYELFMGQSLLVRLALRSEMEGESSEAFMTQYAESVAHGFREDIPSWWPKDLKDLVSDCWHQQPSQRPSFAKILERLHGLHGNGTAADMDQRSRKGYSPANDCGCSVM